MADIEIDVSEGKEKEEPVRIVDEGDSTEVHIGEKKEARTERSRDEDDRWREAEREQARIRAELDSVRQNTYRPQYSPPQDPYKSQEETITEREKALGIQFEVERASGTLTKAKSEEYDRKARELQQERMNIAAQRAMQNTLPQVLQYQQQNHFRTQYADVHANPRALQYAKGTYDILLSQGEQDGPQLIEKAMNEARIKFGTGGYKMNPTDRDRQQLSGTGGSAGRATANSNTVRMGKSEKQMALAMYGNAVNGDEKKAFALWAKGPGLRAKKASEKASRR